jgi:hypothetical protein
MAAPGVMLSLGMLIAAVVVALIGGFVSGSVVAALIALGGAAVGGFGVWKGMQEEKQTGAALSIVLLLANIAFGALTLLFKIIHAL